MQRRQFLTFATIAATLFAVAPSFAGDTAQSVVEAYVAAWNAHDSAKAAGYFADDVSYYDASVGKPVAGRDAAKTGVIDNFLKAVPDAVWTMKGKPLVDGDRISFEWEFSGTNTGAWGDGTAPTGKKFSINGASMFSIKDGKIATQSDYYDALGFYKQLGLM
ncbi:MULTISPECIES: ester cyclase [unclassified Mesorhizobium]|uniref:ester cyclase n=1 Tax=unclassified Mesorhizobium TaxID=325217 RepID=UPI000FCBC3E5|nr:MULTISPECIES: ester cyclase [unclassified Mesorhizobium]TIT76636.1 MAG: ester cyclase [Mesorhizobium sp.]TGP18014.1 polyketide cyclase [Mesorhizobium sp. M1D.F.Ca.ET.231.01.1.1]TGP24637.1 polyketide cyclase [Mesorhizobium sp. M1D.F.Ca.ET.234.01.1.1]TGS37079.1 polyketide cyclase [Mesorhizobium sp. M1D.F.Ca.ET.184.01.1.1]TGS58033.1 polyketide cyclase [Mesorhizobium sp. M1D.F.Ca.ET.183.01.1.1]